MRRLRIFLLTATICFAAIGATGQGLGDGLRPIGVPKADFSTFTNATTAKDLVLVEFTNLAVTAAMTNGWDVKPLEEGANINLSFGDGGDVVVSVTGVLLPVQTNGWDVSAGGGGGGNADDTNYWGVLRYGSNDFQTLTKDVTNNCIFSLETVDFGNVCNPATGHFTLRKTGWWEVHASYMLVHSISANQRGIFGVLTNNNEWASHYVAAIATAGQEIGLWQVHDRAYLLSGTVVRCTFYHTSSADRLGGGDIDHAATYVHNVSKFTMDFIQE